MTSTFVPCDECGKDIPWDSVHIHQEVTEDGQRKDGKKQKYCWDCCPRCKMPAGDLPVNEDGTI